MSLVFDFCPGRSIRGVNPQAVGEELNRIRAKHGELTPHNVLEAAADKTSPLHAAFEWNDDAAAQQWRLQQARKLIVSIRVLNTPAQTVSPAFVSVKTPERGRNYVPTVEALSDEQLQIRVLTEVRQYIESMERKYRHFEAVAEVLARLKKQTG